MTDKEQPRKKAGRPRTYPDSEKRPTLTFRVRGGMHQRLQDAATANGLSLSEEVERRLERSFELETALLAQSENTATLIQRLVIGCAAIESWRGADGAARGSKDWKEHEPTAAAIKRLLRHLANEVGPTPTPTGLLAPSNDEVERIREMEGVAEHLAQVLTGKIELPRGPFGSLY